MTTPPTPPPATATPTTPTAPAPVPATAPQEPPVHHSTWPTFSEVVGGVVLLMLVTIIGTVIVYPIVTGQLSADAINNMAISTLGVVGAMSAAASGYIYRGKVEQARTGTGTGTGGSTTGTGDPTVNVTGDRPTVQAMAAPSPGGLTPPPPPAPPTRPLYPPIVGPPTT